MPTTGATMITTTQASREAGSRWGRSSARATKVICSPTCSREQQPAPERGHTHAAPAAPRGKQMAGQAIISLVAVSRRSG